MSTTAGERFVDLTASKPSPTPSTTGSTGTSGIAVRSGTNGQMSFRRQRASRACEVRRFVRRRVTRSFCSLGTSVHRSFWCLLLQLAASLRVLDGPTSQP
ncbi:hypothetical protein BJX63DRAFT_300647 [Aspergillus granulosus]|uniref:Uncharacterized protein n=1 Tax=Aspergillus granulosus TaxID=176169 RepID=A0ABR4H660_9EURO